MKKILAILMVSMTLLYAQAGQAAIKCWTNDDGYRECGNTVPPKYAQQETRTLDKRGITTEIQGRAKTREEIMEERRISEQQERVATEKREKAEEQATKDRVLLSTFLSREEIIAARDRKIAVFDGYLELSQISLARLKEKLAAEEGKVADLERSGQNIPDAAAAKIRAIQNQIAIKEDFIRQKEEEMAQLRKRYDEDYQRFMELKGERR